MTSLKDICFTLLTDAIEQFLDLQWSDGRFSLRAEYETDEWNFFDQEFILPAALLYVTDRPDNPWKGSERLREAILRHGRHIASRIGPDGAMQWRLGGVQIEKFVCQRLTCAWLQAYRLLGDRLPEEDRTLWREGILRACGWLVQHHIEPRRHVTRFTAHHISTGTNHFSLYLSLLYLAGKEFERPEWVEDACDLMRRLIADQRPGGYWEEHIGPALGYNYLTYHGVEEYTVWSGDPAGREALRRGLDLHMHWTHPDGTPVECIDGRMHHLSTAMMWGLTGFTHWPEGRGYARFLLERRGEKKPITAEDRARIAMGYLYAEEGEEETPAPLRERYRHVLEGTSVVRKEGPWQIALSGHHCTPYVENPYVLDRQCLLSVWRDGAGLVLDGSNSKFQPTLATFRSGETDHQPRTTKLLPVPENEEAMDWLYESFTASIRSRFLDANHLEICLSAFRLAPSEQGLVTAALVPHVSYGESFTIGGVGEVTLGDDSFTYNADQHEGWLAFCGIKLHLPAHATLVYPESPWNSYSVDHKAGPHANRLAVRFPVEGEEALVRLEYA